MGRRVEKPLDGGQEKKEKGLARHAITPRSSVPLRRVLPITEKTIAGALAPKNATTTDLIELGRQQLECARKSDPGTISDVGATDFFGFADKSNGSTSRSHFTMAIIYFEAALEADRKQGGKQEKEISDLIDEAKSRLRGLDDRIANAPWAV